MEPIIVQSEVRCQIIRPRGPMDTGAWNSIVLPDGESETWAEMTSEKRIEVYHWTQTYQKFLKIAEEAASKL